MPIWRSKNDRSGKNTTFKIFSILQLLLRHLLQGGVYLRGHSREDSAYLRALVIKGAVASYFNRFVGEVSKTVTLWSTNPLNNYAQL